MNTAQLAIRLTEEELEVYQKEANGTPLATWAHRVLNNYLGLKLPTRGPGRPRIHPDTPKTPKTRLYTTVVNFIPRASNRARWKKIWGREPGLNETKWLRQVWDSAAQGTPVQNPGPVLWPSPDTTPFIKIKVRATPEQKIRWFGAAEGAKKSFSEWAHEVADVAAGVNPLERKLLRSAISDKDWWPADHMTAKEKREEQKWRKAHGLE